MTYYAHSEAWISELKKTIEEGEATAPRGMLTQERTFVQFEVRNPLTFPIEVQGRTFRNVIGVLEALGMIGQFSVPELFSDRVRKFAEFEDDGVAWGSYGARVHGQIGDVVAKLKADKHSRQAVVTMFDAHRDLAAQKRDIPCTLNIQFLLRYSDWLEEEQVVARATMRSNDLWLGTPYDMIQFSILQATIAQALGAGVGSYFHAAGSLHLYDRDRDKAAKVKFLSTAPMAFPLWAVSDIGEIAARARRLALQPQRFEPETEFESWARAELLG